MIWYNMVWQLNCYAMVCNYNAIIRDSIAMLWDYNAMLCYSVCCKRYP